MRVVKAAAVQLSPVLYSREGTVDKVVRKIDELGRQGVQSATFPETVVPSYPYRPELLSLLIDRTSTAQFHERAARPESPARQGAEDLSSRWSDHTAYPSTH